MRLSESSVKELITSLIRLSVSSLQEDDVIGTCKVSCGTVGRVKISGISAQLKDSVSRARRDVDWIPSNEGEFVLSRRATLLDKSTVLVSLPPQLIGHHSAKYEE